MQSGEKYFQQKNNKDKENENIKVLYGILMKDTSIMSEYQLKKHKITCSYILLKFSNQFLCCKINLISWMLNLVLISLHIVTFMSIINF